MPVYWVQRSRIILHLRDYYYYYWQEQPLEQIQTFQPMHVHVHVFGFVLLQRVYYSHWSKPPQRVLRMLVGARDFRMQGLQRELRILSKAQRVRIPWRH